MRRLQSLVREPLFWIGIGVKLLLVLFFRSSVTDQYFAPFIRYFADTLQNPYQAFLSTQPDSFPYPAVMLFLFATVVKAFGFLSTAMGMKVLVFLADFAILFVLLVWRGNQRSWVLILYWLSPVLLYINYIQGQLDVVPIALLFVSLLFLFRNHTGWATVFLALALAAKTSIVLVVPFYLIFLIYYRDGGFLKSLGAFLLLVAVFVFVNLPVLFDPAFVQMVFLNKTQTDLLSLQVSFTHGPSLIVALGSYIVVLFLQLLVKVRTRTLFLLFYGFAFGAIIFCVPPMPGWYFWFVPFAVYFFASSSTDEKVLFYALQGAFFLYFALTPQSDFLYSVGLIIPTTLPDTLYSWLGTRGLDAALARNAAFTVLQTVLLLNVYWLFRRGVEHYGGYAFLSRPLLLGVGGNSGAGKSRFTLAIKRLFGEVAVTDMKGDDSHRWERGAAEWSSFTHLDPKANHLHKEYDYLQQLRTGKKIHRRHYDHGTGKFQNPEGFTVGRSLVIYDGLHPFYLKKIRELFDIKVFLAPDDDLAVHWKLLRDQKERGYSRERILASVVDREEDTKRFIEPQKQFADIVVSYRLVQPLRELGSSEETPVVDLEISCPNSIPLDSLLGHCEDRGLAVHHQYVENDLQVLRVGHGAVNPATIVEILEVLDVSDWGLSLEGILPGLEGFLQLFFAYYFLESVHHANTRHP